MMTDVWHRLRSATPRSTTALGVDVALAAVFALLAVAERTFDTPLPAAQVPIAVVLGAAIVAGLALRRRVPLTAFGLGTAAIVLEALTITPSALSPYANQIGVYSVALYATRRRAWWALVLMLGGLAAYFAAVGPRSFAGVVYIWLLTWAIGYGLARRREEQEAARRLMRQQAIADERARIARELHDLIGHTVNVMVVQAGAGRRVLDRDPEQTRELLAGVEQVGREALSELDRVLGILRGDPRDSEVTVPGLADVPAMADRMTRAGLVVTVHIGPDLAGLPRSLDLSSYRIVQESLTNAIKHGHAGSARVTVRRDGPVVEIEVCDDGRGARPGYLPGGGLVGIAERAALFGGSVDHGANSPAGFRVRAQLPLPDGPAERPAESMAQ